MNTRMLHRLFTFLALLCAASSLRTGCRTDIGRSSRLKLLMKADVKRVYVPKRNSEFGEVGIVEELVERRFSGDSDGNLVNLNAPQLLIRLKVPKQKTAMKLALEKLQEEFAEDGHGSSASPQPFGSAVNSRRQQRQQQEDANDPFLASFAGDDNNGYVPGRRTKTKTSGNGNDDTERKGSEGAKKKDSGSKRVSLDIDDVYEDSGDSEFQDDDVDDDYYGDAEDLGLSSISPSVLAAYEQEGLSLEEIQSYLYVEHSVKASIPSIKRKLYDGKTFRSNGKKKSGKTRREKWKIRDQRRNPVLDKPIELPQIGHIQVAELADLLDVGSGEIIKYLMMDEGVMVALTNNIKNDLAERIIIAFGKTIAGKEDADEQRESPDDFNTVSVSQFDMAMEVIDRDPIVTIMGHVDHGKTTLLDKIRDSRVALGEAGGITQGISAFKVATTAGNSITFIDTPGHAAFSEMRKRGARVTDIVVLVVAADDGVMDQTKECIAAAKTAGCPIVVAINKVDKEGADPASVKSELMGCGILVEEFGGESQCIEISAKTGTGVSDLLEKIALQAEVMALKTPINVPAMGTIIEARVDRGFGVVATAIVQKGIVKIGDLLLAGGSWGRVKRIMSDLGEDMQQAGPSTPVQIVGLNGVPSAGDEFGVETNEADAKEVANSRQRIQKQAAGSASSASIFAHAAGMAVGEVDNREILKIPLLIKADALGSVEALRGAIQALEKSDESAICKGDIVFSGVGEVSSSDVAIAAAAKAQIIAFNVATGMNAMDDARAANVDIGYFNVVYEFLDKLEAQIETTLAPPPPGAFLGRALIKKVFKLGKIGKVAGSEVTEGLLRMDSKVRVLRGTRNVIYTGEISTLKVVKDDVREVPNGSECGISFVDFSDLEENDVVECFSIGNSARVND